MQVFEIMHTQPHKARGMHVKKILAQIEDVTGWKQDRLSREIKVSQPTISRWKKGAEPKTNHLRKLLGLAKKLQVVPEHATEDDFSVPIVGYVGAGGEIDYAEGQGPFGYAEMPPKNASPTLVAVIVRGDSMSGQLEDGWTVYYDKRQEPPTEALMGKLCVIGLGDGKVLVKRLLPGRLKGCYDLYSANGGPLLDQPVEWAARVAWIEPK